MVFKLHVVISVTGMQRENQTLFTLLVFQIKAAGSAKNRAIGCCESQEGKVSEEADAKARVISSSNVVPLKEAGALHGQGEVSDKTQTKGSQLPLSPGVQNMVGKIEVKMSSASQKTENVSAKEAAKTSVVDGEGKHSNKAKTKVSELGQGVKNSAEKTKVRPGSDAVLHMSRIKFEFRPTQINLDRLN